MTHHSHAKVRSAVLIVGDLGEQCGASDRVRRVQRSS